jgi:glycerophosphoryl diester phosphodiesterase
VTIAIAHRGDPIGHRENTLEAFAAAVARGADMVEIDLRCTRDGQSVVLHDPTLERLWGVDRQVGEMDLVEVLAVGDGTNGGRIPTFAEVLKAVPAPLMVDFTKRNVVEGAVREVMAAGPDALERCLFVTGNVPALRLLRAALPMARIGLTWMEEELPSAALLEELGAEFWNPWFGRISPEAVAAMHEMGLKVSCWTVDEPDDMSRMVAAGVDAVVSNRIADLVAFLG